MTNLQPHFVVKTLRIECQRQDSEDESAACTLLHGRYHIVHMLQSCTAQTSLVFLTVHHVSMTLAVTSTPSSQARRSSSGLRCMHTNQRSHLLTQLGEKCCYSCGDHTKGRQVYMNLPISCVEAVKPSHIIPAALIWVIEDACEGKEGLARSQDTHSCSASNQTGE